MPNENYFAQLQQNFSKMFLLYQYLQPLLDALYDCHDHMSKSIRKDT